MWPKAFAQAFCDQPREGADGVLRVDAHVGGQDAGVRDIKARKRKALTVVVDHAASSVVAHGCGTKQVRADAVEEARVIG